MKARLVAQDGRYAWVLEPLGLPGCWLFARRHLAVQFAKRRGIEIQPEAQRASEEA